MRKTLNQNDIRERGSFRALAAVTLVMSLAAFGCTTNHTAGMGEPSRTPAVGPMTPSSTPGSSSGTSGIPVTMVSSSGVDAIAVLEANRAFEGRVLGPANPGGPIVANGHSVNRSLNMQPQATQMLIGGDGAAAAVVALPDGTLATGATTNLGLAATTQTGASTLGNVVATPIAGTAGTFATGTGTAISGGLTTASSAINTTGTSTGVSSSSRLGAVTSAVRSTSGGVPVRIVNNGGVIVTNQSSSALNQFVSSATSRRSLTAGVTNTNATAPSTTSSSNQ